MCCGNSILQKGLPFFYLHKIFYTLARLLCGHNYSFKDKFQLLILHLFFRDKTFPNGQFCAD
ncbi:hypothetical protein EGP50_14850 [Enterococcus faecium]|nr:hypothetical protein EGP50_14850 [Enterococcus faecium]